MAALETRCFQDFMFDDFGFNLGPPCGTSLGWFWESLFSTEDGQEFKNCHPTLRLQQPEQLQASIPIVAHEDAAPYGKKRSVDVLQWGPLLARGSDMESRFVHHGYISNEESAATSPRVSRHLMAWSSSFQSYKSSVKF